MEKINCPACNAENESDYAFCKFCGSALPKMQRPPEQPPQGYQAPQGYQPPQGYDPNYQNQYAQPGYPQNDGQYSSPYGQPPFGAPPQGDLEGVPIEEVAAFLGHKNQSYMPKFLQISGMGKKSGFNGIVFILSFLLSPAIASFWFFQKKMYRAGIIIFAVGLLIFAGSTFSMKPMIDSYADLISQSEFSSNGEIIIKDETINEALFSKVWGGIGLSFLVSIVSLAVTIFIAIKANYWYKNHVLSSIRTMASDPQGVTFERLTSAGGNSLIWLAALGIYFVVSMIFMGVILGPIFDAAFKIASSSTGLTAFDNFTKLL